MNIMQLVFSTMQSEHKANKNTVHANRSRGMGLDRGQTDTLPIYLLAPAYEGNVFQFVCLFTAGWGTPVSGTGSCPGGTPSPVTGPVKSPVPGPARGWVLSTVTGPVKSPVPGQGRGGVPWPGQGYPQPGQGFSLDRTGVPPPPAPHGQDRGYVPKPGQESKSCHTTLYSR